MSSRIHFRSALNSAIKSGDLKQVIILIVVLDEPSNSKRFNGSPCNVRMIFSLCTLIDKVPIHRISSVEVFGHVTPIVMFQYKSATRMIIHVFGNIEDQFIKNHQYLLFLADFLIELVGSHGSVRYDMGLGHFSQVDTVKDLDDNNNGEEYDDVDYSQRGTARILFIVIENT